VDAAVTRRNHGHTIFENSPENEFDEVIAANTLRHLFFYPTMQLGSLIDIVDVPLTWASTPYG
jgi:hypothetical protein